MQNMFTNSNFIKYTFFSLLFTRLTSHVCKLTSGSNFTEIEIQECSVMIQSIGVDVVDILRFERIVNRWQHKFLERILTRDEIAYCQKKANFIHSLAVRFAAKEAMIKCLSDNEQIGFRWHEMEIRNDPSGRPQVVLNGRLAKQLQQSRIFLSMTHSVQSAIAMIVLETKEGF